MQPTKLSDRSQLQPPAPTRPMNRRVTLSLLGATMVGMALAPRCYAGEVSGGTLGKSSPWMPYAQFKVIQPVLTAGAATDMEAHQAENVSGYKRLAPAKPLPSQARRSAASTPVPKLAGSEHKPPSAYVRAALAKDFDPRILYAVALQESKLMFGQRALPYPWTLCVRGVGERHATYEETLEALRRYVRKGITNVDCGVMQVNWYWHKDKLGTPERALDPYPNLDVGAQILLDHYQNCRDWRTAIARYHAGSITPNNQVRAQRYAQNVMSRLARMGLQPKGLVSEGARHA